MKNNNQIDSYVISSGRNRIGNNVTLRYQTMIARNVIVEDDVYACAGVKTIYVDHNRELTTEPIVIGRGCFLGDNVIICDGVKVAAQCIIGACAFINRDTEPNGVYMGVPARKIRDVTPEEIENMKNR